MSNYTPGTLLQNDPNFYAAVSKLAKYWPSQFSPQLITHLMTSTDKLFFYYNGQGEWIAEVWRSNEKIIESRGYGLEGLFISIQKNLGLLK
jgi:hypothetical protein